MKNNINKLYKLRVFIVLLLIAILIELLIEIFIFLYDNGKIITESAIIFFSLLMITIIFTYYYEKNKIINNKEKIIIRTEDKKLFFVISIIFGIMLISITLLTMNIIISGLSAIIFLVIILSYFYSITKRKLKNDE